MPPKSKITPQWAAVVLSMLVAFASVVSSFTWNRAETAALKKSHLELKTNVEAKILRDTQLEDRNYAEHKEILAKLTRVLTIIEVANKKPISRKRIR